MLKEFLPLRKGVKGIVPLDWYLSKWHALGRWTMFCRVLLIWWIQGFKRCEKTPFLLLSSLSFDVIIICRHHHTWFLTDTRWFFKTVKIPQFHRSLGPAAVLQQHNVNPFRSHMVPNGSWFRLAGTPQGWPNQHRGVNTHMPGVVLCEIRNRAAAFGSYPRLPLAATQRGVETGQWGWPN